ncbi:hypothetical protein C0993_003316, partial [Termitomyces sp. T159_Od127]
MSGHIHGLYEEWIQAMNALANATVQYHIASSAPVAIPLALENLQRMQAQFEVINSKLKVFNLEPILHDLQDQRQQAFDAINDAWQLHETLLNRVDSTSSERLAAHADLLMTRMMSELKKTWEARKQKRSVVSKGEKFEALWTKLSPHANPNAQEQKRKVFYKNGDLDVCDMSIIHMEFGLLFAVRDQYCKMDNFLTEFLDPNKKDEKTLQRKTYAIVTRQPGIELVAFVVACIAKYAAIISESPSRVNVLPPVGVK